MKNYLKTLYCKNLVAYLLIILMGMALISQEAMAEKATSQEMEKVCLNWLAQTVVEKGNWAGSVNPEIIESTDIFSNGILVGKAFSIAPSGFIVVPALREMPVVKAYSEEGGLDFNATEGHAPLIADILGARTKAFIDAYGDINAKMPENGLRLFEDKDLRKWDTYLLDKEEFLQSVTAEKSAKAAVGPLLTTAWNQDYPWDVLCPDGAEGRCLVGCVSTAVSQLMWYWSWPPFGAGEHIYWWSGDDSCEGPASPGAWLSAEFWDRYGWIDETTPNVSELCYEVAVAYDMMFGSCGSGAYTSECQTILPTYFRYRDNIGDYDRVDYNATDWFALIQTEIDAGRPVIFTMTSHAVIADGWKFENNYNQYHLNYGWGGYKTAWYVIDAFHCPVEACSMAHEDIFLPVEPDYRVPGRQ